MRGLHRDTNMPGKDLLWSEEAFAETGTHNTGAHTEDGLKHPPCWIYAANTYMVG